MNIDHLRYFIAVSEGGSITKAAKQHFISPQGMNKAVSAMEAELGIRLFERTHRGVHLTKEGQAFLEFARSTLDAYEGLAADFARDRREAIRAAKLTVGATTYALHTVLEDPFGDEDDDVVRIEELSPSVILEQVGTSDGSKLFITDLFEGSSLAARALEAHTFTPIFETRFGVVSHVGFPLEAKRFVAEDLREVSLACFHDESIDWVLKKTFGNELPSSIVLRTSNTEQLTRRVLSKRCAMLLDSFAFQRMLDSGEGQAGNLRFTPVVDMPKVTVGFLRRADLELSAPEAMLMGEIERSFRQRYGLCPA